MPGSGTHTTIIQYLAQDSAFKEVLGNPRLNSDPVNYATDEAIKSRYAILGALGPDIFYAMLDYGGDISSLKTP